MTLLPTSSRVLTSPADGAPARSPLAKVAEQFPDFTFRLIDGGIVIDDHAGAEVACAYPDPRNGRRIRQAALPDARAALAEAIRVLYGVQ